MLASVLAWQFNRITGAGTVKKQVYLAPLAEEAVKTLPAAFLTADIILTHFFFGAVEGTWEIATKGRNSFYSGLSSVASHSIFGYLTFFAFNLSGSLVTALAGGYFAHALWNYAVLEYFPARKGGIKR